MSGKTHGKWSGNDTIYSESCCDGHGVFYEGSEDEGYDDAADRPLRYEEAGQRFLNGHVPSIMSASLEGPFDRSLGWVNPWMSKRNKAIMRQNLETSRLQKRAARRSQSSTTIPRSQETFFSPPANECHLPSPESLKQAPYTQQHPFLGTEKFQTVRRWQQKADQSSSNHDSFWRGHNCDLSPPVKKRRASGSEWLKKVSVKRRRSDIQQNRGNQTSQENDLDELMTDMPSFSFDDARSLGSPSKQQFPRSHIRSSKIKIIAESDDELSPSEGAAATLSSPVSLHNAPRLPSSIDAKHHSNGVPQSAAAQLTPSHLRHVGRKFQLSDELDVRRNECVKDDVCPMSKEKTERDSRTPVIPVADALGDVPARTDGDELAVQEPAQQDFPDELPKASAIPVANPDRDAESAPENHTMSLSVTSPPASARKEAAEFSFRNIWNRFVPSSSWKGPSHLTSVCPPSALGCTFHVQDSNQGTFGVESATPSKLEKVNKPSTEKNPSLDSASRDSYEASNSDCSSRQTEVEGSASIRDSQSPFKPMEGHVKVASNRHVQDCDSTSLVTPSHQSPRAPQTDLGSEIDHPHSSGDENTERDGSTKPRETQRRPSTPEPRFCSKPFAFFMSPSPDQPQKSSSRPSACRAAAPGGQGSFPSVLKGRWSQRRPNLRVSWAAPLTELDGSSGQYHVKEPASTINPPRRQSSPPPETPMSDLPICCDDKFLKHFEAIANRAGNGKTRHVPTGSPQKSPILRPTATAESLSAADSAIYDDDTTDVPQPRSSGGDEWIDGPICDRGSEEPMDMIEDMVREMGDFWDPWNIDTELEQARKNGSGAPTAGV